MVSMITIILVIYLYCKHKHIRTIIASLILHKAKEVEANTPTRTREYRMSNTSIHRDNSDIIKHDDSYVIR